MSTARAASLPRVGLWSGFRGAGALPAPGLRAYVAEVERLGFGMLWVPEAFGREAMSHAAILLAAGERLQVATGIANIWARDAVAMANGARTLAEAFPGRFVLGIGVSHGPTVGRRGHDYRSPAVMVADYLAAMDRASYQGPVPETRSPRLLAALGPRMLELAASRCDGAHPYLVTPEHTASARKLLGPDRLLAPEQGVVVSEDAATARAAARAHLDSYLGLDNYRRSFLRQGFDEDDLAGGGSDRLVDGIVAWGGPAVIAGRVADHLDAGADHVAVQVLPAGPDDTELRGVRDLAPALLAQ